MASGPDILTKIIFNGFVNVEVSEFEGSLFIEVFHVDDEDRDRRTFHLEPDEVDLFIATLNLYKNRILKGRTQKGIE